MRVFGCLLFFSISSYAQDFDVPNGVSIGDSLYLDATEVANIHWLEFEYYVRTDSSEEYYRSILPRSEVTENYRPDYFRAPNYRYHPVVGLSHGQAQEYCKWRTAVVNDKFASEHRNYRVLFRLPTEQEWELAAKSLDTLRTANPEFEIPDFAYRIQRRGFEDDFPEKEFKIRDVFKEMEHYLAQQVIAFRVDQEAPWFVRDRDRPPLGINEPQSADFVPIFHRLIGNVAEMVQEPGITKGGSWRHKLPVSFPSKRIYIDPKKAYDWVGFRCVAEIVPVTD